MSKDFKLAGYNSLSPYLVVNGAQRMIDLLKEIFGAEELRRYENSDGSIMHAEVRIDDSVLMLGDSSDQYPPNELLLHVYVQDVDSIFEKAISLGCEEIQAPVQKRSDDDKRGMFKDFAGNIWAVGTQV